jgi:hypothetical protein
MLWNMDLIYADQGSGNSIIADNSMSEAIETLKFNPYGYMQYPHLQVAITRTPPRYEVFQSH